MELSAGNQTLWFVSDFHVLLLIVASALCWMHRQLWCIAPFASTTISLSDAVQSVDELD